MIRIGIIGTENTHALAFSKIINLNDETTNTRLYPNVKVVGVYGPDTKSAQQIVDETGAEFIAKDPDDFFGKVDAMMITCRKGSLHYQYAMPFIKKGIPAFIDKPFTVDIKEAEEIIKTAKEGNVKICGGSGCRLAYDVVMLKNTVAVLNKTNSMITGCMNFPADPQSEYDGFFFYASHLTEMALTAFGYDVKSVHSFEKNGSRICIYRYDNYDITMNYTKDAKEYTAVIFAKDKNIIRNIDISLIFKHEAEHFVHMLETGEMPQPYDELIKPVYVINAIEDSIKTGREIKL